MVKLVRDVGFVPSGVNATPTGPLPTEIVADTALVAAAMTDTVLSKFVT
jgi:hypothetical protein